MDKNQRGFHKLIKEEFTEIYEILPNEKEYDKQLRL